MAYQTQTFTDNETVLTAAMMDHIEAGIVANETSIEDVSTDLASHYVQKNVIAASFDETTPFAKGQYVWYENVLCRFLVDHEPGAFVDEEVEYVPEDGLSGEIASAVRYDTAQSLTDAQQTQARENIAAASLIPDGTAFSQAVQGGTTYDVQDARTDTVMDVLSLVDYGLAIERELSALPGGLSTASVSFDNGVFVLTGNTAKNSTTAKVFVDYGRHIVTGGTSMPSGSVQGVTLVDGHTYRVRMEHISGSYSGDNTYVSPVFLKPGTAAAQGTDGVLMYDASTYDHGIFAGVSIGRNNDSDGITFSDDGYKFRLIVEDITEIGDKNIAPIDTPTAKDTHHPGDLLTVSGQLYEATQTIAPGDTINSTNVTETTVAEQLAERDTAISELREGVVRHDTAQSMTDAQKAQARANAGAASQNAMTIISRGHGENLIALTDFTEVFGGGTSYTVDTKNQTITVTSTSGTYRCLQTPVNWVQNHLTPGHTYRLHAKAAKVSGSPEARASFRGGENGVDIVNYDASIIYPDPNNGGDAFVDYTVDRFTRRITLFVSFGRANAASVVFSDIWLVDVTDARNLAPVDTTTATDTHTAGSLLTVGGQLYEATQAIAPGDTINSTKVSPTTVAAQLVARDKEINAIEGSAADALSVKAYGPQFTETDQGVTFAKSGRRVTLNGKRTGSAYRCVSVTNGLVATNGDSPTVNHVNQEAVLYAGHRYRIYARVISGDFTHTTSGGDCGVWYFTYDGTKAGSPAINSKLSDIIANGGYSAVFRTPITDIKIGFGVYIRTGNEFTNLVIEYGVQDITSCIDGARNLAPVDTITAASTHAVSDLLTVNGTLYKATQAIATGETITPGTNVASTTVAEQLAERDTAIAELENQDTLISDTLQRLSLTPFEKRLFTICERNIVTNTGANHRIANIVYNSINSLGEDRSGSTYRTVWLTGDDPGPTGQITAMSTFARSRFAHFTVASPELKKLIISTHRVGLTDSSFSNAFSNPPQFFVLTYDPATDLVYWGSWSPAALEIIDAEYGLSQCLAYGNIAIAVQFRRPTQTIDWRFNVNVARKDFSPYIEDIPEKEILSSGKYIEQDEFSPKATT